MPVVNDSLMHSAYSKSSGETGSASKEHGEELDKTLHCQVKNKQSVCMFIAFLFVCLFACLLLCLSVCPLVSLHFVLFCACTCGVF